MALSLQHFYQDLYDEHVDECAFLYAQRRAYLHDAELTWLDIADWEERCDKHLHALTVGRGLALDVCLQRSNSGDAADVHAALRVFCRGGRKDLAFALLSELDADDPDMSYAAAAALRAEAPTFWQADLFRVCQGAQQHLTGVLANVFGYRRFSAEELLLKKLPDTGADQVAQIAWALGRIGSAASVPALRKLTDHPDDTVCEAAAIAAMRLGDTQPVQSALLSAQTKRWPRRILGIGGDRRAVNVLLDVLNGSGDVDAVHSLGLLGDLRAVAPLVAALEDDDLAASAAAALSTITGAGLSAPAFVHEEIDPDELFDEERVVFDKDGTLPTRADGEPFGTWVDGVSLDPQQWRDWLSTNKMRFNREQRWRLGRPYGPAALFECLRAGASPYALRATAYEELVVRYKMNVPFEADLPVVQQMRFIAQIDKWMQANQQAFAPGGWFFAAAAQST